MQEVLSRLERTEQGLKVTYIGLLVNIALTIFKFIAGILGHSTAMIADSVHSISDTASDIVVLLGFQYVKKPIDDSHNYGHGKIETLSTAIVGLMLIIVALFIVFSGFEKLLISLKGGVLPKPEYIALFAAILSIISKELMYRYTIKVGNKINSSLIVANAWHHRSDALSSIGTMIGIGGAIFLGEKFRILDPIAAIFVSVLIIKVAVEILRDSVKELIETSVDDEKKKELLELISNVKGVKDYHKLRIRHIGHYYSMSIHILVEKSLNIVEAHQISDLLESEIRNYLGPETIITIHIEPYDKE
ncbi:MAG: ferrous iron efflux protein F [Candidatus Methanofastidiosum methylothiophilum]|uniref:Ferrous iron efflux protein F n=1 Tax=Candidatus Methanofastidiosum methylothiophilum TaxID=1705564 RepID=A0A150IKL6_9EURY|nr:MAG: ferrous iron efflux protein F [Candidatus Methanofastidiosum methylthiophilus]KYC47622.1 MAG: ferrous iron efflux protein F [Candidatus Methanofastidiosum methylthiophilus]KYC50239.1 MAG: ferrous iron efflux protein F [Candidatus Methanofastidiosum methylthiophilus]